jgi:hypothetical protein
VLEKLIKVPKTEGGSFSPTSPIYDRGGMTIRCNSQRCQGAIQVQF